MYGNLLLMNFVMDIFTHKCDTVRPMIQHASCVTDMVSPIGRSEQKFATSVWGGNDWNQTKNMHCRSISCD